MADLRRHVPRIALEWDDDAPGQAWQQVDATLVFADISGFTALTEKLARRGRIGAEELIETLNRIFGAMLEQAAIRGGELLKFGGDALLFVFRGDEHAFRACRSAVDMRAALREAAKVPTSVGRLKLSMSVGIHTGPIDFFLVGAPTRELLILGPGATATAEAEKAAVAGEILVTEGNARLLPPGSTDLRPDGLHRLKWRMTYPPEGEGPPLPEIPAGRIETLFPTALGDYLDARVPDPEHRIATIGFGRFSGTDALLAGPGAAAVAEALQTTVEVVMTAINDEGVTLLATDLDSDGGKFFLGSGVPYGSEDDEGRMLRAMRRVLDTGTPLPMQIGVNRGHVFAAEVGARERAAYSAMGDTTNTAARIMGRAPLGILFAHPTVLERSRTLFQTESAGPFPMKGKAVPVPVLAVGAEIGTRASDSAGRLPLVGRDDELAAIRAAVDRGLRGDGSVILVEAGSGMGKSRVTAEALNPLSVRRIVVRAEPYGATSPYRVLRDPLRALLGVERGSAEEMAEAVHRGVRRLAPDLHAFAPLLGDVVSVAMPETPEVAAIEARFRPDRVAELILTLIERTFPDELLLLVEEGHWADAASTHVLNRFAAETRGRRWSMVVTRREGTDGFRPPGATIELGPLPDEVIHGLTVEATRATPMRPHEIDDVVRRAQGNPLYVEEITRVFAELGSLEGVPDNLHAALDAQIDALDPHSRRVLRYASVLGQSFRRNVIAETLRSEGLVVDSATLSRLTGFIESDGGERFRFRNGMIRDAAYDGLAYRLRARIHAAAGRAVEKLSDDLEADADTLSLHFWRGGDAERTWTYSRMAGDRAARAFANVDAAVLYDRALDAARSLPGIDTETRRITWRRLGDVRNAAGMITEAVAAYGQALRLTTDDHLEAATIHRLRARARQRAGSYTAALSELTRAQRLLDGDDSVGAHRMRLSLAVYRANVRLDQERLAELLTLVTPVLEQARPLGELEALEQALLYADVASFQLGDMTVGARTLEALEVMAERGVHVQAPFALSNLAAFAFYAGRWDEAVDYFARAAEAARSTGDTVFSAIVELNLGEVITSQGRPEEALPTLDAAVRVLRVSGVPSYAAYASLQRARAVLLLGRAEEAERELEEAELELLALGQQMSALEAALVRCEALTVQGRPDAALLVLEAQAEAAAEVGGPLAPRVHLEKARALAALARPDEALAELDEGERIAEETGLPYEHARLLSLRVEVLRTLSRSVEADEAAQRAEALLHRLGARV
jgi:class 3 adenylate cyclase/tetratricopeptide (TPR) repeat protein